MPKVCAICISKPNSEVFLYNDENKNVCTHSYCNCCIAKWAEKETTCPQCKRIFSSYGTSEKRLYVKRKFQRKKQFMFRVATRRQSKTVKKIIAQGNSLLYFLLTQEKARRYFMELIEMKNNTAIKFLKGHIMPCITKTNSYYQKKYQCSMVVDFPVFYKMAIHCMKSANVP